MSIKLISAVVFMGMIIATPLHAFDGSRGGSDGSFDRSGGAFDRGGNLGRGAGFTNDRDQDDGSNFEEEDYQVSDYKKRGKPQTPGTPVNQIIGDTPPPHNSTMSRMIGEDGTVMGNHH